MSNNADRDVDERFRQAGDLIHCGFQAPGVFREKMNQLQAIHRWLSGYFEAAGIMLQIPGAGDYEWLLEEPDHATEYVWKADRDMLLSILAEALERLDAGPLLQQVPGAETYKPRRLPVELRLIIAERDRNGVMNIVGECLDWLMVIPEVKDDWNIFGEPRPTLRGWGRCWRTVVSFLSILFRRKKRRRCAQ